MNTQYFCSPQLSVKLQKLGVESQFDLQAPYIKRQYSYTDDGSNPSNESISELTHIFHWSDMCLLFNAEKIWGDMSWARVVSLMTFVNNPPAYFWQEWLEQEVDKRLSEKV